jgi:hypothetical protein
MTDEQAIALARLMRARTDSNVSIVREPFDLPSGYVLVAFAVGGFACGIGPRDECFLDAIEQVTVLADPEILTTQLPQELPRRRDPLAHALRADSKAPDGLVENLPHLKCTGWRGHLRRRVGRRTSLSAR